MEAEKRSSKGGFLQLFEWNAKAKKKLFSNKSELPEGPKQVAENFDSSSVSKLHQANMNKNEPSPVNNFLKLYDFTSSVNSDEGCTSRAPGVVARLMGLDSLPTSDTTDSDFTPFCNPVSFHSVKSGTRYKSEHHMIQYGNLRNQVDGFSRNLTEFDMHKVENRIIERFQTEILPPKSAKSISITHHRLLSPIRNPGFVQTKNAAYIMEAAAKIIDNSPRSTTNVKLASFGSSSVPLRIRDLKEKMEAAAKKSSFPSETSQRSEECGSVKLVKQQSSERKNQTRSEDSRVVKASITSGQFRFNGLKEKERLVSLAIQAKVNGGKREPSRSSSNRSVTNQKGGDELSRVDIKQQKLKSNKKTASAGKTSHVLIQNNQKQNCAATKERNVKASASNRQNRKSMPISSSPRPTNTVNEVASNSVRATKKTNFLATTRSKDLSASRTMNFSTKKRLIKEHAHADESLADDVLVKRSERPINCDLAIDEGTKWDAGARSNCTDVVSFTFTSPIKKVGFESSSFGQIEEKNSVLGFVSNDDQSNLKNSSLSSLGINTIGGDALNVLLEEKLNELTCKFETFHYVCNQEVSASTSLPNLCGGNIKYTINDRGSLSDPCEAEPDAEYEAECSSIDSLLPKEKLNWLEPKNMDAFSSNGNGYYQYSSSVSSLGPSFSEGSYYSSDGKAGYGNYGCKECSSSETYTVDCETDLSDSASSMYAGCEEGESMNATLVFAKGSFDWVLKYVRCMLSGVELMLLEFASGQVSHIISPDVFDVLESNKTRSDKNVDERCKLGRKILFDCVNECLEYRCRQLFSGSFGNWTKWHALFWKESLAEDLYKEIAGWRSMEDFMVDEIVGMDMSTQYGKWIDFELEGFEEGEEIGNEILNILVDELVVDLL